MNPESQIPQPSPESGVSPQTVQESGCGVSPQTVPGATLARHSGSDDGRSESTAQDPEISSSNLLPPLLTDLPPAMPSTAEPGGSEFATAHTAFRSLGTSSSPSCDDMGFVDPPETYAAPDYDGDFDYEDDARKRV